MGNQTMILLDKLYKKSTKSSKKKIKSLRNEIQFLKKHIASKNGLYKQTIRELETELEDKTNTNDLLTQKNQNLIQKNQTLYQKNQDLITQKDSIKIQNHQMEDTICLLCLMSFIFYCCIQMLYAIDEISENGKFLVLIFYIISMIVASYKYL